MKQKPLPLVGGSHIGPLFVPPKARAAKPRIDSSKRDRLLRRRTPAWANKRAICNAYTEAVRQSIKTGVRPACRRQSASDPAESESLAWQQRWMAGRAVRADRVVVSRCHVRCRKCEARRVLSKHPDQYARLPVCSGCGARSWRADRWMNRRKTGLGISGMGCDCGGYWFRHRKGSLYCWRRADGSERYPGDDDFQER
jgi:hypothetical protein